MSAIFREIIQNTTRSVCVLETGHFTQHSKISHVVDLIQFSALYRILDDDVVINFMNKWKSNSTCMVTLYKSLLPALKNILNVNW